MGFQNKLPPNIYGKMHFFYCWGRAFDAPAPKVLDKQLLHCMNLYGNQAAWWLMWVAELPWEYMQCSLLVYANNRCTACVLIFHFQQKTQIKKSYSQDLERQIINSTRQIAKKYCWLLKVKITCIAIFLDTIHKAN